MGGKPNASLVSPRSGRVPLLLKVAYSLFVFVLVLAYWRAYGPQNFLWFSDVALFMVLVGLWLESSLLVSMAAVGVLWFAIGWTVAFFLGDDAVLGLDYMYDDGIPFIARTLSLFHAALPPLLIWLLYRLGYDRRAPLYQTPVVWAVLIASYAFTDPAANVNWAFGPLGPEPPVPGLLWLGFLMVAVPALVCYPAHLLLQGWFGRRRAAAEEGAGGRLPEHAGAPSADSRG